MKMPHLKTVLDNKDNQEFLASIWRFADIESDEEIAAFEVVKEHFKGFTPELSKRIGWSE